MAYEVRNEDEDDINEGLGANGGNQVPLGQGAGVITPNSVAASATDKPPVSGNGSGSYTNLQQYIAANQDQTGNLVEKTSAPISNTIEQTSTLANQGKQAFQGKVEQGSVNYNPNLINSLQQQTSIKTQKPTTFTIPNVPDNTTGVGHIPTDPSRKKQLDDLRNNRAQVLAANAAAEGDPDPEVPLPPPGPTPLPDYRSQIVHTQVEKDASKLTPEEKAEILRMRNAQYLGPQSIETSGDLQEAYNQKAQAEELANLTNSEDGRFELLRRAFTQNGDQYARGERRLDQALLQQDPTGKDKFAELRTLASALDGNLDTISTDANKSVGEAKTKTAATAANTKSGLSSALASNTDYLNKLTTAQKAEQTNHAKAIQDQLTAGLQLGDYAGLEKLILGSDISDFDLSNYIVGDKDLSGFVSKDAEATNSTVASKEDLARIQALAELADTNQLGIDPYQVGQYQGTVGINKTAFTDDVINRLNSYDYASKLSDYTNTGPSNYHATRTGTLGNYDNVDSSKVMGVMGNDVRSVYNTVGHEKFIRTYQPMYQGAINNFEKQIEQERALLKSFGLKVPPRYEGFGAAAPNIVEGLRGALLGAQKDLQTLNDLRQKYLNPKTVKSLLGVTG